MSDKREGFVIYRSHIDSIRRLPADMMKECLIAMADYALDGKEYDGEDPIVDMFMALVKPQVDANNKRYENGRKGGRPKKQEEPKETEPKPKHNQNKTEPKPKANCEAIVLNDGTEWLPDADDFAEYKRLFPNTNVEQEFAKMRSWSISNPQKRKTKTGVKRFVNNWLSSEQDRARSRQANMITIPAPQFIVDAVNGKQVDEAPASEETKRRFEERMKRNG